jgi:transcriptional regulator of acetoin/glycerol metabolism
MVIVCCQLPLFAWCDRLVSSLDLSINQAKQQSTTLHIGTHILSESSKDNTQSPNQTRYQLNSHLQSNTLELDDKTQTRLFGFALGD